MTWDTKDVFARRREFVCLANAGGVGVSELCRRFGISRKTGYKWLGRFAKEGEAALVARPPARPRRSNQTDQSTEEALLALRGEHPTWGPRKLRRRLQDLGSCDLPAVSTVARLLKRSGCIDPVVTQQHQPWQRFTRPEPNELWQMDFKGHFALHRGRCHPLTVLDDHSRYLVGLRACDNEQTASVQPCLTELFAHYGLPGSILCDNGPPWAGSGPEHTVLTVWLLRLGVRVIHGRPFHPQTQGKDERFHRTLKADLLARHDWSDLSQAQRRFDAYRRLYNHDRPHEALDLAVPASRYRPSPRPLPTRLPIAEYEPGELVRPVKSKGEITFRNRFYYVGRAFAGLPVALRPTATDGVYRICYAAFTLGLIDCSIPSDLPKGHYHPINPYSS
ncbi:MAG: IS481 family transposase [Verrucomicrobiota bacterium]